MLTVGDIHIYASDFQAALRFWSDGLQLKVAEAESGPHSAFARLDFPDGGPSLRLIAPVEPWAPGTRPETGARPTIRFDLMTSQFDEVLVRLLEHGGRQEGEIETYNNLRVVTIADPDGNSFDLIEVPGDT
jgi:catechol 2,3-dioxygenase-like lactoylglutathione lyase family enzyme